MTTFQNAGMLIFGQFFQNFFLMEMQYFHPPKSLVTISFIFRYIFNFKQPSQHKKLTEIKQKTRFLWKVLFFPFFFIVTKLFGGWIYCICSGKTFFWKNRPKIAPPSHRFEKCKFIFGHFFDLDLCTRNPSGKQT